MIPPPPTTRRGAWNDAVPDVPRFPRRRPPPFSAARRDSGIRWISRLATAGERTAEGDLVGVFEVGADRQTTGEARDLDAERA